MFGTREGVAEARDNHLSSCYVLFKAHRFMMQRAAAIAHIEALTEGRPTTDAERAELCERYRWEIVGPNPL
jgi:hypothetical protein